MTQRLVTQLLETDLISLKFLLKRRLTNVHDIRKKEQQVLNNISNALQSVKNIEQFLLLDARQHTSLFFTKRRDFIIKIMRFIVHHFCEQIRKGEEIANESVFLREELDNLFALCKRKTANKQQQEQLLKTLADYSHIMI